MFNKTFTTEEIKKQLPLINRIALDILQKARQYDVLVNEHDGDSLPEFCDSLTKETQELIAELEELGCFLKDYDFGKVIIDFPAILDESQIFYCWRSDTPDQLYMHAIDEKCAFAKQINSKT